MSQTKQWGMGLGTTTRRNYTTGATAGSGGSQRLYVGRYGAYDYKSYLKPTPDWTNVGKIVSAILSIYTDDGLGVMPSTTTETPTTIFRRLTSAFGEGSNNSSFVSGDYTAPGMTTSAQITTVMNRAASGVTQIDVTAWAEAIAPATVKTRSGAAGGQATNYGFALIGSTDTAKNWAGFSEDYSDSSFQPIITLTYEYGPTAPNAPTNLAPSGSVAALADFSGDFSDVDTSDRLASSEVEVYTDAFAGAASTGDVVTAAGHGLANGAFIYFTSLTGGTGLTTFTRYCVRDATASTFKVTAAATSAGTPVDITVAYSALAFSKRLYDATQVASNAEVLAAHFLHVADSFHPLVNTTYRWRARLTDNEGSVGSWSALTSFSVTNTDPNPPTLTPASASSYATLDGVQFRGTFSDADAGDTLLAYQVQMSAYPSGDAHWLDDQYILWNTGKRYVTPGGSGPFETPYGGSSLSAGTYYWRARVWDNHQGHSDWTYASIVVTQDFIAEPDGTQTAIQLRPRAPWRIVIRDMLEVDGVTRKAGRGPGNIVAILEDAKNAGASKIWNSPGELHFTLVKDHPQISVIEPKQTHYSVQFYTGIGWQEKYAGLMWDFDATETDVVFYGIDYLALLGYVLDERYDPSNPDKAAELGGSKYVSSGKNSIAYIVTDQLTRAKTLPNSPVGFINIGSIATMTETLTVFSTYAKSLDFIASLLDSHRAGTGKRTMLSVKQGTGGTYEFVVDDDPGVTRDELRMRYGELVQGYRVVPFGANWASRVSAIGRAKDGLRVMYKTQTAPGIDEAVWGRFTSATFIDGVADENDLIRRTKQAAVHSGKLGQQVGLGLRSGILQPFDGYSLTDQFPIDIVDGSVDTNAFGSGYWVAVGVTWTVDGKTGKQDTNLTFQPREDSTPPDSDLLTLQPISPQAEWQIGWSSPNPLTSSSKYWLDQSTGKVYVRTDGTLIATPITGTP